MEVWAVLNLTPDSFYPESRTTIGTLESKVELALQEGADIIDMGAESTRPFAEPVDEAEEWSRLEAALDQLAKGFGQDFLRRVSVDTQKPVIAAKALDKGVGIINDVSGLADSAMAEIIHRYDCRYVLMHTAGNPQTMQVNPRYDHVVRDVLSFLEKKIAVLRQQGVKDDQIILDYGIGFGKNDDHNRELLQNTARFREMGFPLLAGISRKSFLGRVLNLPDPEDRLVGTIALHMLLALQGVDILRVHDVREADQVRKLANWLVPEGKKC